MDIVKRPMKKAATVLNPIEETKNESNSVNSNEAEASNQQYVTSRLVEEKTDTTIDSLVVSDENNDFTNRNKNEDSYDSNALSPTSSSSLSELITQRSMSISDDEAFNAYHSRFHSRGSSRRRSSKIGDEGYDRELNNMFKKIYNRHRDSLASMSGNESLAEKSSNDDSFGSYSRQFAKAYAKSSSMVSE